MAVVVEHGGGGGATAGPLMRDVVTELLTRDPAGRPAYPDVSLERRQWRPAATGARMSLIPTSLSAPRTIGAKLANISWPLLALLSLLACIGIAMLYSVAGGSLRPWADRHALRFVLAIAMVIALALTPLELWLQLALSGLPGGARCCWRWCRWSASRRWARGAGSALAA